MSEIERAKNTLQAAAAEFTDSSFIELGAARQKCTEVSEQILAFKGMVATVNELIDGMRLDIMAARKDASKAGTHIQKALQITTSLGMNLDTIPGMAFDKDTARALERIRTMGDYAYSALYYMNRFTSERHELTVEAVDNWLPEVEKANQAYADAQQDTMSIAETLQDIAENL